MKINVSTIVGVNQEVFVKRKPTFTICANIYKAALFDSSHWFFPKIINILTEVCFLVLVFIYILKNNNFLSKLNFVCIISALSIEFLNRNVSARM